MSLFSRRLQAVLCLHLRQLSLLFVSVHLLEGLVGLVVEDDEVAVAHVEPGEVIARVLGVKNVFVHDKGRAASLWGVASKKKQTLVSATVCHAMKWHVDFLHSNLSDGSEFAKNVVHFFRCDFVGQISNVEHSVDLWR